MVIKIFGRDISIIVHFQGEEGKLADEFIKFKEIFLKSEFMTTSVSGNGYQWKSESDCRKNSIYFRVMVKAQDEEKFYAFLKKFCEERGITFQTSTSDSEIENDPEKITFEYDGKTYVVKGDAYDKNLIRLPDGRILKVGSWVESCPPQPAEIEDVTDKFSIAKEI